MSNQSTHNCDKTCESQSLCVQTLGLRWAGLWLQGDPTAALGLECRAAAPLPPAHASWPCVLLPLPRRTEPPSPRGQPLSTPSCCSGTQFCGGDRRVPGTTTSSGCGLPCASEASRHKQPPRFCRLKCGTGPSTCGLSLLPDVGAPATKDLGGQQLGRSSCLVLDPPLGPAAPPVVWASAWLAASTASLPTWALEDPGATPPATRGKLPGQRSP